MNSTYCKINKPGNKEYIMRKFFNRVALAFAISALTSVMVFAEVKKETVTFYNDITVNGTLVKKGTYRVKFDTESGELSILKGGKVVAKTTARAEQRDTKPSSTEILSANKDNKTVLVSITFGGEKEAIVISGGSETGPANQ
jgi:hypothetical protein